MRRIARIVLPVVVLLAFAAFVWPTPWVYFSPASGSRPSAWQLRRNRFTGTVEWLGPAGWTRCEPEPPKRPARSIDAFDEVFGLPPDATAEQRIEYLTRKYGWYRQPPAAPDPDWDTAPSPAAK